MPTKAVGQKQFRAEAERRLIDSFDLMLGLGLRSKTAIWQRVARGTLPKPVIRKARTIALWDQDEVLESTGILIHPTDRKED